MAESTLNLPGRFADRRTEAYISLGDRLYRALKYEEAERKLLEGVNDLKVGLRRVYGNVFDDIRAMQQRLIIYWLRSIKIISDQSGRPRRFFGAVLKAGTDFNFLDEAVLFVALGGIEANVERLNASQRVSRSLFDACSEDIRRGSRFAQQWRDRGQHSALITEFEKRLSRVSQSLTGLSARLAAEPQEASRVSIGGKGG